MFFENNKRREGKRERRAYENGYGNDAVSPHLGAAVMSSETMDDTSASSSGVSV